MIEHKETVERLHPDGLTSLPSAAELYDVDSTTLRRWWKLGKFPKPVKQGDKNFFKNSDLLDYNDNLQYIDETA